MGMDPVRSPLTRRVDGDDVVKLLIIRDSTAFEWINSGRSACREEKPYHSETPRAPSIQEVALKNMP